MQKDVVIFVHINKCAGSTLEEIFVRNYGLKSTYEIELPIKENVVKFKKLSEENLKNYVCIIGHMGFGLHQCFKDRKIIYVTILREPIRRLISMYNHTKRSPTMPIWKKGFHPKMTFEEFVDSRIFFHTNNGQTRYLTSCDGTQIDLSDKPYLDEQDLERAKQNLKTQFEVVGVQENFDATLLLLKEILKLKNIYYLNRNVTMKAYKPTRFDDIPKSVINKVEEENKFDIELYEYVKILFKQKLEMFPSINDEAVKTFRAENKRKMRMKQFVATTKAQVRQVKFSRFL